MKQSMLLFLSGLTVFGTGLVPLAAQPAKFESALEKTEREDFTGAIQDLKTTAVWFEQRQDDANAYKSRVLADYLQWLETRKINFERGVDEALPFFYQLGSCLGADCAYSLVWVNPESEANRYGGVLILEKNLRMISHPDGSGIPVVAIVDVQIVPSLKSNETIMIDCTSPQIKGKDTYLFALVQPLGQDDEEYYTQIRQAWKIEPRLEKIETLPSENLKQIRCVNPCPGGC
ncbi:hypothetical protein C7H19_19320 [Aphanothece hegewaldii CCALA 016]|uniref:Uncharacterized protein n=1 Tax=Aphanothece hegewaldii CCALA 016 TaxID=2107694 RepID=A0A2T1LTA3_9CHRO|nr:hypothetical protein [Aphanothece hegewaldii]PSF33875.1 hypothetical protein C7H19_19320 [Aphanothece hegewaldii CCALA 016]